MENRVFTIRANQSISLTSSMSTCVDIYEFNENGSNRITLSDNLERSITRSKKKSNMREAIIDEIDQEKGEFKKLPDVVASSHLGNQDICIFLLIFILIFTNFINIIFVNFYYYYNII